MIQGILSFQFIVSLNEQGVIMPEFKLLQSVFSNDDNTKDDYSKLVLEKDIYSVFYQHTTGIREIKGEFSNFFVGRLKLTPRAVISYFLQLNDGSQFLTIVFFELDDELDLFRDLVDEMAEKLNEIYPELLRAANSRKLDLIEAANDKLRNLLELYEFQIKRLSNLDKLQKIALIYSNSHRRKILEVLRERPISKRELKSILEQEKAVQNIDILLDPFIELNILRRDWIAGKRNKETGMIEEHGEFLFLTKDVTFSRAPCEKVIKLIKEKEPKFLMPYMEKLNEFFDSYDLLDKMGDENEKFAKILLNPDMYDFFCLMRENYYGLDKIPKILSEWADTQKIMDFFEEANLLTVINDERDRSWLFLLTEIKPIIIFPEYILPKIREALIEKKINLEIARKAFDLLEVTFPDAIEFL